MTNDTGDHPGLYVHVPFCRGKCPYCGFYSMVYRRTSVQAWLTGLLKEIQFYKNQYPLFDTLYVGGGTPSCVDTEALETLMNHLLAHFRFTPGAEMTLEANPGDMSLQKAKFIFSLGFNRINLGVQSFDNRILRDLGREHTAETACKAIFHIRIAGFENVGLDLIYGIENQRFRIWIQTLKEALRFQPEHLSCYQLTMEPKTVFKQQFDRGERSCLSERKAAAFFLGTSAFLERAGYAHYEISNFARSSRCMARHNRKYWEHVPYLGLGPSAHSFDGKKRWWNVNTVRQYAALLNKDIPPVAGQETLSEDQRMLEGLALGFRTRRGVDLSLLSRKKSWRKNLEKIQEQGFVKVTNGRAVPTRRGFLVADHLPLLFSD